MRVERPLWAGCLGAATVVAVACGSEGGRAIGDAAADAGGLLRDAGELLLDAGGALSDAALPDADAQTPTSTVVTATCDEYTRTTTNADGSSVVVTYWYANATAAVVPGDHVHVITCDEERFGSTAAPPSCATGSVCVGEYTPPPLRCQESTPSVEAGRLRAWCGHRITTRNAGGTVTSDSGQRWGDVAFTID